MKASLLIVASIEGVESRELWSRRLELNQQPAVYKLDSELPDTTHDELTQGKTDESEEPSS